jgi:Abortive infection alpha
MATEDVAGTGASLIPVTDAQAELGKAAIEEGGKLGRYVGRILGDVPSDMVQVFIGQHLRFARILIADSYDRRIRAILERRHARTEPLSPSVAIPLIQAAYDESRPDLQELWAALIATAMDPARSDRVRLRFIDTLKQFDPLDALVLRELGDRNAVGKASGSTTTRSLVQTLGRTVDEIRVTVDNLERLRCAYHSNDPDDFYTTNFGRELLRACAD